MSWKEALAGGALGGIFNLASRGSDARYQREMAEFNQGLAQDQAKFMQQLNLDTWNKTNVGAQMEHLKKAGLNPALMYKQGGAGGTLGSGSSPNMGAGNPNPNIMGLGLQTASLAKDLALKEAQKANLETETESKAIDNLLKAEGLEDKKLKERVKADIDRRKAQQDVDVLFGNDADAKTWDSGSYKGMKVSRYQQAEMDKLKGFGIDNLVKKAQEGLSKATASNLLSNDELVRLQTSLLSAELGLIESETFKKLPGELQAILMVLIKRFGG